MLAGLIALNRLKISPIASTLARPKSGNVFETRRFSCENAAPRPQLIVVARADVLDLDDAVAVEPVERERARRQVVELAVQVQVDALAHGTPAAPSGRSKIGETRKPIGSYHRGARP